MLAIREVRQQHPYAYSCMSSPRSGGTRRYRAPRPHMEVSGHSFCRCTLVRDVCVRDTGRGEVWAAASAVQGGGWRGATYVMSCYVVCPGSGDTNSAKVLESRANGDACAWQACYLFHIRFMKDRAVKP